MNMAVDAMPIATELSTHAVDTNSAWTFSKPRTLLRGQSRRRPDGGKPDSRQLGVRQPDLGGQLIDFSPSYAVERRTLTARGMAAEVVQGTGRRRLESQFRGPYHMLIAYVRGTRRDGETFVDGMARSSMRDLARKFVFVPAWREYRDWIEPQVNLSAIYFYFDPAALVDAACEDNGDPRLPARLFFDDPALWDTALKIKGLLESVGHVDRSYFEALGSVLAHEVTRLTGGEAAGGTPVRGGLAAWQQRKAATYIEEHLAEPISLATMAQLVRLSPHYFCRAFKQSFGMPPHRYHTNRRIEHAKQLLVEYGQSVTHIALAVGFAETSSFSAAFRRATGVTPSDYRRSLG